MFQELDPGNISLTKKVLVHKGVAFKSKQQRWIEWNKRKISTLQLLLGSNQRKMKEKATKNHELLTRNPSLNKASPHSTYTKRCQIEGGVHKASMNLMQLSQRYSTKLEPRTE
uniref:Uncharacterized protein n=1 Tax=Arundo donax TaxID=35708 RepID=A0A0A9CG37_ARUDO